MQKEEPNEILSKAENVQATPRNKDDNQGGRTENEEGLTPGEKDSCAAGSKEEFERLIKGPYKEAFSSRVQGIINQRFKEKKMAQVGKTEELAVEIPAEAANTESTQNINSAEEDDFSADNPELALQAAQLVAMGYSDFDLKKELEDPTFKALLKGGVDMQKAYQAIHFDEIMDSSVKFGAETAAKQMADSIRFKAGRPGENGLLSRTGFGTRLGVSSLTPEKRRQLARKAMMGEKISF